MEAQLSKPTTHESPKTATISRLAALLRTNETVSSSCIVQRPNERWALMDCEEARRRGAKLACRREYDDRKWNLAARMSCATGFVARPPTNAFANALLRQAAVDEGDPAALVLLNVSARGTASALPSSSPTV